MDVGYRKKLQENITKEFKGKINRRFVLINTSFLMTP